MKKLFFSTLIFTILSLYAVVFYYLNSSTTEETQTFTSITEKGELVVALDENQPGYFKIDSTSYGFDYTLIERFCKDNNLKLTIVPAISSKNTINMLSSGEIDMACTVNSAIKENSLTTHILGGAFSSNFVILTKKAVQTAPHQENVVRGFSELSELTKTKSVVMPHNFTTTTSYDMWLDSVSNSAVISYDSPQKLISKLGEDKIDFLVCSKIDAEIALIKSNKFEIFHTFDEKISSILISRLGNVQLEQLFRNWMLEFSATEDYATLSALYSDKSFLQKIIVSRYNMVKPINGISHFDDLIRQKSNELGYDWRLVSAIAYNESHFRADAQSHKGALGLMQVMPRIARHFGSSEKAVIDPSNNIEVALRLLKWNEKALKFPSDISLQDKTSILLACYNGGLGHVMDAQNLARKYGKNPYKWEDVSFYLDAKAYESYYNDEIVENGKFISTETISYVSKVWEKYNQYCSRVNQ
ncbi:MAG: transglycosylase SLT domain-containing protein [Rikenellaceae bacterium]